MGESGAGDGGGVTQPLQLWAARAAEGGVTSSPEEGRLSSPTHPGASSPAFMAYPGVPKSQSSRGGTGDKVCGNGMPSP